MSRNFKPAKLSWCVEPQKFKSLNLLPLRTCLQFCYNFCFLVEEKITAPLPTQDQDPVVPAPPTTSIAAPPTQQPPPMAPQMMTNIPPPPIPPPQQSQTFQPPMSMQMPLPPGAPMGMMPPPPPAGPFGATPPPAHMQGPPPPMGGPPPNMRPPFSQPVSSCLCNSVIVS